MGNHVVVQQITSFGLRIFAKNPPVNFSYFNLSKLYKS